MGLQTNWCRLRLLFAAILAAAASPILAQQRGDRSFTPNIDKPTHSNGTGPLVLIDEGHHNYHTKDGRYRPFSMVLEADGYQVGRHPGRFTAKSLADAKVLVIANALHQRNVELWALPTPSAFNDEEIGVLDEFVTGGGALFLIVDHMPFPGAAAKLAERFGVLLENGFVFRELDDGQLNRTAMVFNRDNGGIVDHPITTRMSPKTIDQVASFTGCGFRLKTKGAGLLKLGNEAVLLSPQQAWKFGAETPRQPIAGWLQGAALEHGRGRVVVFGEAAMFTSQTSTQGKLFGMTATQSKDNQQLLVNSLRWLTRYGKD